VASSFLVLGLLAGAVLGQAGRASGAVPQKILFPVVGPVQYENDFGDPRGQGRHEGNDIMAGWRFPAVAVEPGTVRIWTSSASAGCMLYLYGKSGTTYLYIHLNNDRGPKNDNRGKCRPGVAYAPGLQDGQRVRAGQLIGYVGDSGDANGVGYHLHFELHPGDGRAVSPYRWLRRAETLLFALPEVELGRAAAAAPTLALTGTVERAEPGAGAEPGLLTLSVKQVDLSSGGSWKASRSVTLTVPPETAFERAGQKVRAGLASLRPGDRVVVSTSEIVLSLTAQLARPGVLAAARVQVQTRR
jgi:hypothetical protein